MNLVSAEQDNLDMMLTQMGADVKSIHGLLCFVRFNINGIGVFYVYNINAKNQYYLQKVLPYPVGAGLFSTPFEIVDYIKNDVNRLKKVSETEAFDSFIKTNVDLHHTLHKVEETYLDYDVPAEKLNEVSDKIAEINKILDDIQNKNV